MKFRTARRLGTPVSEIGLGCWQLGSAGWDAVSEENAGEILNLSVHGGINFIDTADVYGGAGLSESRIGAFLKTLPKPTADGLFIASKLGRLKGFPDSYSYDLFRQCTLDSVSRIGRPLDLQQLHCVPHKVLQKGDCFDWLRKLKAEGLIKHFGASVESMDEAKTCLQHADCDSLQIIFNIFRQKPIDELFAQAKEKGVAIIIRLPLASGVLAGKYTKDTKFSSADHRNFNANGEKFNVGETFAGIPFEKAVELTDAIKPLLNISGETTLADAAMRWILDYDAVTTIIPGASKPAQAKSNLRATDMPPLPRATHDALRTFYTQSVKSHIRGPY